MDSMSLGFFGLSWMRSVTNLSSETISLKLEKSVKPHQMVVMATTAIKRSVAKCGATHWPGRWLIHHQPHSFIETKQENFKCNWIWPEKQIHEFEFCMELCQIEGHSKWSELWRTCIQPETAPKIHIVTHCSLNIIRMIMTECVISWPVKIHFKHVRCAKPRFRIYPLSLPTNPWSTASPSWFPFIFHTNYSLHNALNAIAFLFWLFG